jgi:hypothetical protein
MKKYIMKKYITKKYIMRKYIMKKNIMNKNIMKKKMNFIKAYEQGFKDGLVGRPIKYVRNNKEKIENSVEN